MVTVRNIWLVDRSTVATKEEKKDSDSSVPSIIFLHAPWLALQHPIQLHHQHPQHLLLTHPEGPAQQQIS